MHTGIADSRGYDVSVNSGEDSGDKNFGNYWGEEHRTIPTLGDFGLVGLAALLGGAGAIALRRRKSPGQPGQ